MSLWQTFLIMEIFRLHGLSPTERQILLAKFPNPDTVMANKEVAKQLIDRDGEEGDPDTVRRQMWTIYNERFCPKENRDVFPDYCQKGTLHKDKNFLAWLQKKYEDWLKLQSQNTIINNDENKHFVTNPFIPRTGVIENPQLLFGREREIKHIFEILNSGSSVALVGERKIGKSSILQVICKMAEISLQKRRKAIYLNLQRISNENDFYLALCDLVGIPLKKGYLLSRELQKHKLLLILDEVEKMAWEGFTSEVRGQLRTLAEISNPPEVSNPPLRLVVAASTSLDLLFPDSKMMPSPFQGVCLQVNLEPWNEKTCREFIEARLAMSSSSYPFTEEDIIQLVQKSGGHPQKLMQLCYETYSRYVENMK